MYIFFQKRRENERIQIISRVSRFFNLFLPCKCEIRFGWKLEIVPSGEWDVQPSSRSRSLGRGSRSFLLYKAHMPHVANLSHCVNKNACIISLSNSNNSNSNSDFDLNLNHGTRLHCVFLNIFNYYQLRGGTCKWEDLSRLALLLLTFPLLCMKMLISLIRVHFFLW